MVRVAPSGMIAVMQRREEYPYMGLARSVRAFRKLAWSQLVKVAPFVLPGQAGNAVRYAVASLTHLAPLELTIARGDTAVLVGVVPKGELWDMVRLVGPRGRVIAVEPFPDSVRAIQERADREGHRNVTVIPYGAWSAAGQQRLYIHPEAMGSHIVLDSGARHDRAMAPEQYAGAIDIKVDRLDDLLAAHGVTRCDFIKITVMGAEMHVLAGMDRLLQTTPKLWVKAHSLIDGAPANRVISKMLVQRGYRTVTIRGNVGPGGIRPDDVYAARRLP